MLPDGAVLFPHGHGRIVDVGRLGGHAVELEDGEVAPLAQGLDRSALEVEAAIVHVLHGQADAVEHGRQLRVDEVVAVEEHGAAAVVADGLHQHLLACRRHVAHQLGLRSLHALELQAGTRLGSHELGHAAAPVAFYRKVLLDANRGDLPVSGSRHAPVQDGVLFGPVHESLHQIVGGHALVIAQQLVRVVHLGHLPAALAHVGFGDSRKSDAGLVELPAQHVGRRAGAHVGRARQVALGDGLEDRALRLAQHPAGGDGGIGRGEKEQMARAQGMPQPDEDDGQVGQPHGHELPLQPLQSPPLPPIHPSVLLSRTTASPMRMVPPSTTRAVMPPWPRMAL